MSDLGKQPAQPAPGRGPFFASVPEEANSPAELRRIAQDFADWVYYDSQVTLLTHPELNLLQRPDETELDFKLRLRQAARERRDEEVDRLRSRYADEMENLERKLRRQQRELAQDEADYGARRRETTIATGEMLLTLFSRRSIYRDASWRASRRRLAEQARFELEESREELKDL